MHKNEGNRTTCSFTGYIKSKERNIMMEEQSKLRELLHDKKGEKHTRHKCMKRLVLLKFEVQSVLEKKELKQSNKTRWNCKRDASSLRQFWCC